MTFSAFLFRGEIVISVAHRGEENALEFSVRDTGVGIPHEMIPLIFEKFRQLDSSDTRLHEGVGLGLFIVKSFTALLGGTIRVESELGRGSLFSLTIPCRAALDLAHNP